MDDWQTQESKISTPYLLIPDVFLADELVEINRQFDEFELRQGETLEKGGFQVTPHRRNVLTAFWPRDPTCEWIHERIDKVMFAAAKFWGFDVRQTVEDLKLVQYPTGGHFQQWHADSGPGYASRRKLSISVELTDHSTFEGGELEIFPDVTVSALNGRVAGSAVVFPSHRHHRVMPVTSGTRRALINWISGPPLR